MQRYQHHIEEYETDVFSIENLHELSANYVLFEISGLHDSDEDYDNNIQYIIKKLSYALKHPATVIIRDNQPFLVVRDEAEIIDKVPAEFLIKRDNIVYLKRIDESFPIDFVNYRAVREIVIRFLQFDLQTELNKLSNLWQPGSGDAFFSQDPYKVRNGVSIYNGFFARVVELPRGGFGFSIDVTKKYVSEGPLNVHLTRRDFERLGGSRPHFIYQYGNQKYEIKADQFSDLNATQFKFQRPEDGAVVTLLEDVRSKFGQSMPPEVAKLPDNASVLLYKTNDNQERRVIAGLCYQVFDTEDPRVSKLHKLSILDPFYRRRLIRAAFQRYFKNISFGGIKLKINPEPLEVPKKKFRSPDLLFGDDTLLTVNRNLQDAQVVSMNALGKTRKALLTDKGFYTVAAFEKQYFVVPETVFNMYGNKDYFLLHLISLVNRMHPSEIGWDPEIITYDNRNKKDSVAIGFEILKKIKERVKDKKGGYALVMLPSDVERVKRQHDKLAALVVSECLEEHTLTASIMHNETLEECFAYRSSNGKSTYHVKHELEKKYQGYLFGVAVNQVLLNNERWPYVLHSPLNADLTIGIDVKRQIAGFTFVDKYSKNILTRFEKSKNKERLSTSLMIKMLVQYITHLKKHLDYPIEQLVFHRDGRLFQPEKDGIMQAIEILKEKKVISANCSVNIVEIPKHSIVPFRLFEVTKKFDINTVRDDNGDVLNPQIGSYVMINKREAFLCTTGREFRHQGTSIPLYIKYNSGEMDFEKVLQDLYFLSCLAYTKPDDCSRFPITIKITDRRINTLGEEFDLDSLDILRSVDF
ncbi:argonaute/piwi family protein [Spirosoma endophyticum]|uniref:Piwi domain-containing protein n=1 Tax=Spirosoma endophyticum TaxID=662367 RepID=A0A1I2BD20_9BACT|nr:hypothetical protein [Spirosoma endophyticum]SFE53050.1 hypothetical protein SAMN05216167_11540 [Spirosoma endophyticum]